MGKIAKGSAMTAAVLGTLAFLFGTGVSISAWILNSKVSQFYVSSGDVNITFKNYWWGGITYVVPGILGIIAGCTRNVTAMVFYMIFNILCLLSSIAVSILVALYIVAWAIIEAVIQNGGCADTTSIFYSKQCTCIDYEGNAYVLNNLSCSDVTSIQSILAAIVALASISSLIAFISSYVSCCALCNQESDSPQVIIQGGVGYYQPPPNVVISNSVNQQIAQQPGRYVQQPAGYAQQPPPYGQMPYNNPSTHHSSKQNLVKSEVI